jgi:DNA-binding HxlR family transcriptional regulator
MAENRNQCLQNASKNTFDLQLFFVQSLVMKRPPSAIPKAKAVSSGKRRSPCPVACALDTLGDRWTLLIIRDLILGRSRFREFTSSPEGLPTNILSNRLQRLLDTQIVTRCAAADGTKRLAYQLTEKGQALGAILAAMRDWGLAWEPGAAVKMNQQ